MFEEIPRRTRGPLNLGSLGTLPSRRVMLGPFALGGGLALATLGGSVAVAATVITASTFGIVGMVDSHPNHPHRTTAALLATSSQASTRVATTTPTIGLPTNHPSTPAGAGRTGVPSRAPAAPPNSHQKAPAGAASRSATPPSSSLPGASPSAAPSNSSPAGNAVVFFDGYDPASGALLFRYADVTKGGGPRGSDAYSTQGGAKQYQAVLATGASIISGNTMCPPAGSRCTPSQLDTAAVNGMYAEVGIGPAGRLESVIERDNAPSSAAGVNSPSSPPSSGSSSAPSSGSTSGGSKSAATPSH